MQYKQQIYKIPWRHAKGRNKKDENNKGDIRKKYREREVRAIISAHKDTKFSALIQQWLFFYKLQIKLQIINHASLWNLLNSNISDFFFY